MALDLQTSYWTWKQFNSKVDELCPLECKRLFGQMNPDGSSVYYRNHIRQAVLDLGNFIDEYTENHETIYFNRDLVADGEAHVGTLPPFSEMESAWYYSTDRKLRYPVKLVPWERRFELTTKECQDTLNSEFMTLTAAGMGALEMADTLATLTRGSRQRAGIMAISPKHEKFYIFPQIQDNWLFSLFWDGQKLDYRDAELVPFEEEAAQAVAWYVQAQFQLYVDKDPAMAETTMRQYNVKRSNLYTRTKDKGK